jgi:hypothetical protein
MQENEEFYAGHFGEIIEGEIETGESDEITPEEMETLNADNYPIKSEPIKKPKKLILEEELEKKEREEEEKREEYRKFQGYIYTTFQKYMRTGYIGVEDFDEILKHNDQEQRMIEYMDQNLSDFKEVADLVDEYYKITGEKK